MPDSVQPLGKSSFLALVKTVFGTAEVIIIKHVVKPLLKPCYLFVDRAVKTSTPVFAEVFRDRRQNNDVRRGVKADKEPALIIITSSQRWGGESFLQVLWSRYVST